ncbi:protein FAR1-RELATED SEQUENCE 11-like [Arachis stenosperma]|uniref:protein FAR1-RELATED SEQUENCE 11-like n=1 Tax=Arachis stenosperma TaxID=217475 RepID=UPI0025AD8DD8|nr:protein FAR1-RELATED SEQUENCE 11-like [Arachis stenosperma]
MDINRMFDIKGHESDAGNSDEFLGHYRGTDDEYDDVDDMDPGGGPEAREQGAAHAANCRESGGINDVASGTTSRQVVANDFLGREFATEEDAYAAYKEFAKFRGFGVRKGVVARVNGVLVRRDFFCHRQGKRHAKHYDRPERVKEERLESRTDYKAKLKIYYDVQHNVWKVRTIKDKHNHELAPVMFTHLLPSHRKMSVGHKV